MQRRNVLVSAYAISPYRGSEYGVAWNFVSRLRQTYDLTVLYGTSGDGMGCKSDMERYFDEQGTDGVEYVFVSPSVFVRFFDWLNIHVHSVFFAFSYALWQRQVLKVAKRLCSRTEYSLIHQLNTIGFRQPGWLWILGKPFVWGPVGGASNLNPIFYGILGVSQTIRNKIRDWSNIFFLRHSKKLRAAVAASSDIFCATEADARKFLQYFGRTCAVIRENAISEPVKVWRPTKFPLRIVWVGRIDEGKALSLLIKALSEIRNDSGYCVDIVGDGPLRVNMEQLAVDLGVSNRIVWHGLVDRGRARQIMNNADIHILTSIMDSNPTVIFEAFEACVPSIVFKQFGMAEIISDDVGFVIDVTTLKEMQNDLSHCITDCLNDPRVVDRLKKNILSMQDNLNWDRSIESLLKIYEKNISS